MSISGAAIPLRNIRQERKNKMILRKKKGFTIVELVIVIAVIGVLAAVLIPTFISLNKKAEKAADSSLVSNLNTALRIKEGEDGKKNKYLHEAVLDLDDFGYKVTNIVARSEENIVWDEVNDEFVLTTPENPCEGTRYWEIRSSMPASGNTRSIYAGNGWTVTSIGGEEGIAYGFDAGYNPNITSIHYKNAGSAQTVTIRTNGGTLTIDAENDTVNHYGEGLVLDIKAIAGASYHEYGSFPKASIAQGRIVVENDGNIPSVEITAVPTSEKPIEIETGKDIVVSASQEVVEELGSDSLENVGLKVTNAAAEVVVDEKIDKENVEAEGKTAEDLVSITKVGTFSELNTAITAKKPFLMFTSDIAYTTNGSGLLNVIDNITIDGDGHTLSGYGIRGSKYPTICINNNGGTKMVDVKLQNLTVSSPASTDACRPIESRGNLRSLTLESVTVNTTGTGNTQGITFGGAQATAIKFTMNNSTISTLNSGYPIISFNPFEAEINDSYIAGYCGIYFKSDTYGAQNCKVVANRTTFYSPNKYTYSGANSFGVFAFAGGVKGNSITLNDCKVNVEEGGSALQALALFSGGGYYNDTTITVNGADSFVDGGISINGQLAPSSKIVLNGGTYTENPVSAGAARNGAIIAQLGAGKTLNETSDFTWIVR